MGFLHPTDYFMAGFPILSLTLLVAVVYLFALPTFEWGWLSADLTFVALLQPATTFCVLARHGLQCI